jgi:putative ABC transport system permease protein
VVANARLHYWLLLGALRLQPGRWILAVASVAFGIALAVAIHSVNHSALSEFNRALAVVNGQADGNITAKLGEIDETLIASLEQINQSRSTEIAKEFIASPILELTLNAEEKSVRVIGLDLFRAAYVTPDLLPAGANMFDDSAIFLTAAQRRALNKREGDALWLSHGNYRHRFIVAGLASPSQQDSGKAVMDLGTMQWRLGMNGKLSRIDLRLSDGWSMAQMQTALKRLAPEMADTLQWQSADAQQQKASNLSKAYRVNLNVLALVALFTGGFLVFAAIHLAATRQRARFGILGCLGASPSFTAKALLLQGILVGAIGGALGMALGIGFAQALLNALGSDLGSGYFSSGAAQLVIDWPILFLYWLGAIVLGVIAAGLPAWQTARENPIEHLRPMQMRLGPSPWKTPIAAALIAAALLTLPALGGIPWFSYMAIAIWLVAGIALTPWLVRISAASVSGLVAKHFWHRPPLWLAWQRVQNAPGAATAIIAGVVASFALSAAMGIMVHSFREAVTHWLDRVLPADLYVRGPAGGLTDTQKQFLTSLPGAQIEFLRVRELQLAADEGAITLLARPVGTTDVSQLLPLKGQQVRATAGTTAIYISEAMQSRYGWQLGDVLDLPLGVKARFHVSGIWRDYARSGGTILLDEISYQTLTGDKIVNDAAIRFKDPALAPLTAQTISAQLPGLSVRSAQEIRALSLRIFDRSFAVTYALEAAAIIVGLFGLGAAFSAQAMARQREFGMLAQLGLGTRQILAQLSFEAMLLTTLGVAWGAVLGLAIAAVLVFRINPQSFHWTMPLSIPYLPVLLAAITLVTTAGITAALSTRSLMANGALNAVRQDA